MPSVDNGSLTTLDEPCLRCSSTATIIRGRSNLNRRSAVVATAAHHPPRRKQRAITIRSDHALKRLELRSEEHTSELQSLMRISYAVFCLKKKNNQHNSHKHTRPH